MHFNASVQAWVRWCFSNTEHFLTHGHRGWLSSFKHRADASSRYTHPNKNKKNMWRDAHHVPSFTMFFRPQFSATHEMLLPNKQANQQNKLSTHVRAIGGTGSGGDETSGSSVNKRSLRERPTVSCPARCGSVTCDSLTSLSADPDCWLSRRRSDGEACLFPPSHWARIQGGQNKRNASRLKGPAGNKRDANA